MEIEIIDCSTPLKEEIIRVLNRDENTIYTINDIKRIKFSKVGIFVETKDGNSYLTRGRSVWH